MGNQPVGHHRPGLGDGVDERILSHHETYIYWVIHGLVMTRRQSVLAVVAEWERDHGCYVSRM